MRGGFHEARGVIQNDKTLDAQALYQNIAETDAGGIFLGVAGDEATECDAAVKVHAIQNFLHDFAADVFKINIDAVGSCSGQLFFPVRMLVVDGGVEAEIFGDPGTLLVAAGDAHNAAAVNLSDLSSDASRSSSGGADD